MKVFNKVKNKYIFVETTYDWRIERETEKGERRLCEGFFCTAYETLDKEETGEYFDDFCLAVGFELPCNYFDLDCKKAEKELRKAINNYFKC